VKALNDLREHGERRKRIEEDIKDKPFCHNTGCLVMDFEVNGQVAGDEGG